MQEASTHASLCIIHDDALVIHSCNRAEATSEKNALTSFYRMTLSSPFTYYSPSCYAVKQRNDAKIDEKSMLNLEKSVKRER